MGKKIYKTFGRVMAIVAVILCCFSAKASSEERVLIGDLWYVLDGSKLTAAVVREELEEGDNAFDPEFGPRNDQYLNLVGDIEIPKRVSYKGSKYTVTSIAPFAFYRARNLTSVTIANTVTNIGAEAFCYCSGLKKVKIRDAVDVVIQRLAFSNCTSLTSIILPSRLKYMGLDAFSNCKALESVTWNAKNCEYWCWISPEEGDLDGIISYDQASAFRGCENISSFVFGEEVETIPNGLLCYDGYTKHFSKIKEIVIPNSVTSIGFNAFSGCDSISSLIIPPSLQNIGYSAFSSKALESVTWNAKSCKNFNQVSPFRGCENISSFVFGEEVESIPNYLLISENHEYDKYFSKIKTIIIPNSVISIGAGAFRGCDSISDLVIGKSLSKFDDNPFLCENLQSVTINEFNKNFDSRNNCNAIIETETNTLIIGTKNTIIPNSVTGIGDYSFYNLRGLESIKIPSSVTTIGNYAFYSSGLESIKIPSSVTNIGNYAFYSSGLKSIKIPSSIRNIGVRAFPSELEALYSEIHWPERVTLGHEQIKDFVGDVYEDLWAFDDRITWGCTLHVPRGTAERYRATDGWRDFHKIVEDMINGDINGDEITDVSDVVAISNHVLGDVGTTIDSVIGDVNGSGAIDVADVVTLANYVLGE